MAEGFDPASISESILDSLDTEHDTAALLDFASEFSTELMAKEVLKVYEEFGT